MEKANATLLKWTVPRTWIPSDLPAPLVKRRRRRRRPRFGAAALEEAGSHSPIEVMPRREALGLELPPSLHVRRIDIAFCGQIVAPFQGGEGGAEERFRAAAPAGVAAAPST